MQTPSAPGWYDDPTQPDQLRYFDGVLWTDHTTPRSRFTPPAQSEPAAQPVHPTQVPPQGWPLQPGAQNPSHPTAPQAGPLTPAPLPTRAVAYVIDKLIVGVLSAVFGLPLILRAIAPIQDELTAAVGRGDLDAASQLLVRADRGSLIGYVVLGVVLALVYHVFFLVRFGATPGKLMLGLRVRRLDRPGPLDRDTAIRRAGFEAVLSAMSNAPYVGTFGLLLSVADVVWPVTDPRRQALHDKVAGTIVVRAATQPAQASRAR